MSQLLPFRDFNSAYGQDVESLGKGAYGSVYLTDLGFAIKMSSNNGVVGPSILNEIVSLLKVNSPNVITLIDVSLDSTQTRLALPVADSTLTDVIAKPGLDVLSLITQLCFGLADIHNSNLLHLDLKPDNLLLTQSNLWIADLGLSQIHTCVSPSLEGDFITISYRPPELFQGEPVTPKADVWSVGVIIAEMLISQRIGKPYLLFTGTTDNLIKEQILTLSQNNASPLRRHLKQSGLSRIDLNFIMYLLQPDYLRRPSIFQVLQHPWMQVKNPPIELTCRQRLLSYTHFPSDQWPRVADVETQVTFRHRHIVIGWMFEVTARFGLSNQSVSIAIYLLDRWMTFHLLDRSNIQEVASGCLFLGSSIYDGAPPSIEDFVTVAGDTFTEEELISTINLILTKTSFDLAAVTSYFFLVPASSQVVSIWKASTLTEVHFDFPDRVAEAITLLSRGTEPGSELTDRLRQAILDLSPSPLTKSLIQEVREILVSN